MEIKESGRRLCLLQCTSDLLVALFSLDGSRLVKIEGMPLDARIVGVSDQVHFDCDVITFKVESAEFNEVKSGQHVPEFRLSISESTPEYNWGNGPTIVSAKE